MSKKHITITSLAAVLVLSMAALAFAGPGHGYGQGFGNCGGPGYGAGAYSQLTPEKQVAVEKIIDKYDAKFDELRTQMWTKHATLQAMINGGNADEKKIGALTAELTKLRDQMGETRDAMRAEIEKETGLVGFGGGRGYGHGRGMGYGNGMGPGYGMDNGQGRGFGPGDGSRPCWN